MVFNAVTWRLMFRVHNRYWTRWTVGTNCPLQTVKVTIPVRNIINTLNAIKIKRNWDQTNGAETAVLAFSKILIFTTIAVAQNRKQPRLDAKADVILLCPMEPHCPRRQILRCNFRTKRKKDATSQFPKMFGLFLLRRTISSGIISYARSELFIRNSRHLCNTRGAPTCTFVLKYNHTDALWKVFFFFPFLF